MVYNDFQATFEELVVKDKSVRIHCQNTQQVLTEIRKALHVSTNIYGVICLLKMIIT